MAEPSVVDRLGYAPHDLIGQSAWSLVHTDDLEEAADDWADVAENGTIRRTRRGTGSVMRTAAGASCT